MQASQIRFFNDHGHVRLERFHPASRMLTVKRQLLDELRRLKAWAPGQGVSGPWRKLPLFQQNARLSALVRLPGLHAALMTPELLATIARLANGRLAAPQEIQLLLSPPRQGAWTLERLNWHVDVAAEPTNRLPGIQAFVLIDDVAPQGGATLALAGSHRARAQGPGALSTLRQTLAMSPWPAARLHDLGLSVVEMSGQAGDVVLMDMRLLHTPSVNATNALRVMATSRVMVA